MCCGAAGVQHAPGWWVRGAWELASPDGPDLAPEVAKLEGLTGKWEQLDYTGIVDFMHGNQAITRNTVDWQERYLQPESASEEMLHSGHLDIDF